MAIEKKFLQKAIEDLQVKDYLNRELEKAGVSKITIQKTPVATRIMLAVRKPGMVVGKKGKAIKDLCDDIQQKFGIENPQFEVVEVAKPALDARLVAERIGRRLEMRPNFKPIMRITLKEIMEAGAMGAEIRLSGKLVGKGGKAKTFAVRAGYLKKSGAPKKKVLYAKNTVYLKAGAIGIKVKIVPPGMFELPAAKKAREAGEAVAREAAAKEKAAAAPEAKPEVTEEKAEETPKKAQAPRKKPPRKQMDSEEKEQSAKKEDAEATEKTEQQEGAVEPVAEAVKENEEKKE